MINPNSRDIKYFGKDFSSLKKGLMEFAKAYYPNTYNDFNEASPGMMFVEMAAYVGDVLSYYIDNQYKENMIAYATDRRSVTAIAYAMGYKPKLSIPSVVDLDVFQLLPPSGSGSDVTPDMRYAVRMLPGMQVRSSAGSVEFLVQDPVDFAISNDSSPTDISVYSVDGSGAPTYFLAKKTVKAISARRVTTNVSVGGATKFYKTLIQDDNLIGVDSIVDSEGNIWYEVPYLAQDTIFEQVENTSYNDPDTAVHSSETPYILKLRRVPRRFITRVTDRGIEVQFGSGISTSPDEEIITLPDNIGLNTPTGRLDFDPSIDPTMVSNTSAYGLAPSNTTLTITYLVGGGVSSNVPSGTITEIIGKQVDQSKMPTSTGTLNSTILNTIAVNNPTAASGGRSSETVEEIRNNALAQLHTQNRAVTREDYIARIHAMPSSLGSVAKAFIMPDEQNNLLTSNLGDTVSNPLAMNLYLLGYDSNKNLTNLNAAIKESVKTYLSQYKMLTDSINIRDAYVINIQVNFDIIAVPGYNANEVLLRCIDSLRSFFAVEKWQINQPIVLSEVYAELIQVRGVQTVSNIVVSNVNDDLAGYSPISYNIVDATRNGIIYPSLDPSIFEVKFPSTDIKGRIANY